MRGDAMLSAVSQTLAGIFSPEMVRTEMPLSDVPEEYLLVEQAEREQAQDRDRFFYRSYLFDICYHPQDGESSPNRRAAEVEENLFEHLTSIAVDGQPIKADLLRSEKIEGVHHFFASYRMRVMQGAQRIPAMEYLNTTENIKED